MSYADIAKGNTSHLNPEISSFIEKYYEENSNELTKNKQLINNINQLTKIDDYIKNMKLSNLRKNGDHFTLTLHFSKKSEEEKLTIINELTKLGVPLNNIFTDNKGVQTKVFIMVNSKETLGKIIENRHNLKYYTSSRDYHVVTGTVTEEIPVDIILKTLQHGHKDNSIKLAFQHTHKKNNLHHIFGLIEYDENIEIKNFKLKKGKVQFSIKQATNAYIHSKKNKTNNNKNKQSNISKPQSTNSNNNKTNQPSNKNNVDLNNSSTNNHTTKNTSKVQNEADPLTINSTEINETIRVEKTDNIQSNSTDEPSNLNQTHQTNDKDKTSDPQVNNNKPFISRKRKQKIPDINKETENLEFKVNTDKILDEDVTINEPPITPGSAYKPALKKNKEDDLVLNS